MPSTTSPGNLQNGKPVGATVDEDLIGAVVPVVRVVPSDQVNGHLDIHPGNQDTNAGDTGLGSPAPQTVVSVVLETPLGDSAATTPGHDDAVAESLRLLTLVDTAEDPYRVGGKWAYANEVGGRCFSIMQYETYPPTGQLLMTEDVVREAVARKGVAQHAWVCHDKDVVTKYDLAQDPSLLLGSPKGKHWHVVERRRSSAMIGQVARAYGVPPERVEKKPDSAFLDVLEYQTHEHPNEQAKGRHLYLDDEINASPGWDWRSALDAHKLSRTFSTGKRANVKRRDALRHAVMTGVKTLREVRRDDAEIYAMDYKYLQGLRGDFLANEDAPETVINIYIFGPGGVGKDLFAKAIARGLAGDIENPYFKVGGDNVSFERYDGEPVLIFEDMRVGDLLRMAKSRGMLFRILGPYREPDEKPIVNIKNSHTQLLNRVNIVTGPEDYETFLKGLAGEYVSFQGGVSIKHEAENLAQGYRRFPLIIPVSEGEFSIYVNMGFLRGTREYESYIKFERLQQDLEGVARRCAGITDQGTRLSVRRELEARTVAPVLVQHSRLIGPSVVVDDPDNLFTEFAGAGEVIVPTAEAQAAADAQRITTLETELAEMHEATRIADARIAACTCGAEPAADRYHAGTCELLSTDERQSRKARAIAQASEVLRRKGFEVAPKFSAGDRRPGAAKSGPGAIPVGH